MNPLNAFDRILAALHQAVLDDAHWPAASALTEEACGAVGSALVVGERDGGEARIYFARYLSRGEPRQDVTRDYFQVHYPHDPGMRRLMRRPQGRVVHVPDLYTEEERKQSPIYNEGWRRLEARNGLNVHFDEPDGLRVVWAFGDPVARQGWQSPGIRLIEHLMPHVRHFVRVRQALAAADALDSGLSALLDERGIGVIHLDRSARVLAANDRALALLRRGDGLTDDGGTLGARLPSDRSRLRRLLRQALPDLWGEPPSGGSMTIHRPSGRSRLGLHVSPVGDAWSDFGSRRAAALVLVIDPARRARIDSTRVAAMLGLTASEGRVAALLAEAKPVREIAAATGFRETYVRWLIQQVYKKLGVSGQVALARQVLAVDALPKR